MRLTSIAAATVLAFGCVATAGAAGQMQSSQDSSMSGSQMDQSQMSDKSTVRQAQKQLSQKGYNVQVDGKQGPRTEAAIRKFQNDNDKEVTGQLDDQTLDALGIQSGMTGSMPQSDMDTAAKPKHKHKAKSKPSDMESGSPKSGSGDMDSGATPKGSSDMDSGTKGY